MAAGTLETVFLEIYSQWYMAYFFFFIDILVTVELVTHCVLQLPIICYTLV